MGMGMRFRTFLAVTLLLLFVSSLSAAPVSVYRWNNYKFRVLGLAFPNTTAPDQAGIQVMIGDGTLTDSTVYVVTVQYDLGDNHREVELLAKAKDGWATTFVALGKRDEDFRIVRVTAVPYQLSGPEVVAATVQ
jgi:hypothetical protein